jgi:hypothetical protein
MSIIPIVLAGKEAFESRKQFHHKRYKRNISLLTLVHYIVNNPCIVNMRALHIYEGDDRGCNRSSGSGRISSGYQLRADEVESIEMSAIRKGPVRIDVSEIANTESVNTSSSAESVHNGKEPVKSTTPGPDRLGYLLRALTLIGNLALLGAWVFMVIFGVLEDINQIDQPSMNMTCVNKFDEDDKILSLPSDRFPKSWCETRADGHDYIYSPTCCTSIKYSSNFKIINIVGGSVGIVHVSYFLGRLLYEAIYKATNVVFLFRTPLLTLLVVSPSAAGVYTYQRAVYKHMMCNYGQNFCDHDPPNRVTVMQTFDVILLFSMVFCILQLLYVAMFLWTFLKYRLDSWLKIQDIENSLFVNGKLENEFEARKTLRRTYQVIDFVESWMDKDDSLILRELPAKTRSVMWTLIDNMDTDRKDSISRSEFDRFALANNVRDVSGLWSTLTSGFLYESICYDSVEDLLYDLFFQRKQMSCMIHTDLQLLTSMVTYISMVLYPGCGVIASKIVGYQDAFGDGIDLFKTYIVIISFLSSRIMGSLQYLWLMIQHRPYNIGDVMMVDNHTYKVISFNTTHTFLLGSTAATITNDKLLEGKVVNLSKERVSDSFEIKLPLNSTYNGEDMSIAIRAHMNAYPRDVLEDSIRIGWVGVEGDGKILRCNWRYKFKVLDRSRLNTVRTRIIDCLGQHCNDNVIRSSVALCVASGGGANNDDDISRYIRNYLTDSLRKKKNV